MLFKDFNLAGPIMKALQEAGFTNPTPIQEKAIPAAMEGRDIAGCAQTGTGKTAAFAIPMIELLNGSQRDGKKKVRGLILTPTRELALQIGECVREYGKYTAVKHTVIYGGVSQGRQVSALRRGVDIIIATPGRLLDLVGQGFISLSQVEYFVLDEADRMLDMGFIHDIRKIINKIPKKRQTFFFSATMPQAIRSLSESILKDPVEITIKPDKPVIEKIKQSIYYVDKPKKKNLLLHILRGGEVERALVFSRTKHGADKIVRFLHQRGIDAGAIHGDKTQNARQKVLQRFKDNRIKVLVATDIASRGIDIDSLSHVVNIDLPEMPETYVHRIGRTGRAGKGGIAISFCDKGERGYLGSIQKMIRITIPVVSDHPYPYTNIDTHETNDTNNGHKKEYYGKKKYRGKNNSRKRFNGNRSSKRSTQTSYA